MYKTFRGQTDGTFKTQTLLNREYIVVPVIAMVEGVRYGSNQESPELGLAAEFGHFPATWNNRPIVLGHPQIDGEYVSAGDPAVMEKYSIGLTMNSRLSDKKLKTEAWLDTSQRDKSDESKQMFDRIEAGEEIEVSVGFFTDVEEKVGVYEGKDYNGIWRNVASDHLAFLPQGTIGACSIADGCGAPRVNQQTEKDNSMANKVKTLVSEAAKKLGVKVETKEVKPEEGAVEGETTVIDNETGKVVSTNDTNCGCNKTETTEGATEATVNDKKPILQSREAVVQHLIAQSIPDGLMSSDIESILSDAIGENYQYSYIYGFTNTTVIYTCFDGADWDIWSQEFSIDTDGKVTLSGTPTEVRLITRIVPVGEDDDEGMTTNSTNSNTNKEKVMTKNATKDLLGKYGTAAGAASSQNTEGTGRTVEDVAAKPVSVNEYIEQAPAEIREVLNSGIKMHAEKKEALIAQIKKVPTNTFDDTFLKAQSLDMLEQLAKLASVPTESYAGMGAPRQIAQESGNGHIAAPKVFEVKDTTKAA